MSGIRRITVVRYSVPHCTLHLIRALNILPRILGPFHHRRWAGRCFPSTASCSTASCSCRSTSYRSASWTKSSCRWKFPPRSSWQPASSRWQLDPAKNIYDDSRGHSEMTSLKFYPHPSLVEIWIGGIHKWRHANLTQNWPSLPCATLRWLFYLHLKTYCYKS